MSGVGNGKTPNWPDGYVPPASEWNAWWQQKMDWDNGVAGPQGPRGEPGHDDTLYIPELFDDIAAFWPGQKIPITYLPTTQAVLSTVPWTTLSDAGTLGNTDGVIIGRAGGSLVQANPAEFATLLGPYIVDALGLAAAPALGLSVTSTTVAGVNATINGKYLDNGFHAGMQYSLDGGTNFLAPAPADLTLTPSGLGGTYSMIVRNLPGQFWKIVLRLNAYNAVHTETPYFPVGTAATIGFLSKNPIMSGLISTAYGMIGLSSSYITGQWPALSTRNEGVYSGPIVNALSPWFGNQQIQCPCVAGTYLFRIRNSPENYAGSPYVPWDISVVITPALVPSLWMEPVPTTRYRDGPYPWVGQWGFSKPPGIEWRVSGGDNFSGGTHGTYDTGWRNAGATIGNDGSISCTLPMIDTSFVPPLPPDNGYTAIQWRRTDDHTVTTVLHAMLP